MPKAIHAALALSVITLIALASPAASSAPLKVVASFSVIGDFARNVGGERVEVTTLVGPNGDAHVYEPKPTDAVAVAGADVVLVNGLHFEGFLQRLIDASATRAAIVEVTKGIAPIEFKPEFAEEGSHEESSREGHDHGPLDPHAFQSVANAKIYVKNIADAFCMADTDGCVGYQTNAEAYMKKLDALDGEVKSAIASIPEAKRVVITSHDAFGYFEHEYGLTFLAPQGISTDAEPSAADVAKLVKQIRQDKASAIFVENITNPKLVEQIAGETGIKVGGTLYSDSLSPPDGPALTYLDMMRSNIAVLKGAILGS